MANCTQGVRPEAQRRRAVNERGSVSSAGPVAASLLLGRGAMFDLLPLEQESGEQIVFVGEAARRAGGLARALECLGFTTAHAPSVDDIDDVRPPAAVVVAAEEGADPFAWVRAVRMCGRLADSLVFAWAPETLYRPVAVAVAVAAGADDVVGGRLRMEESVDRVARRLRPVRTSRTSEGDADPASARRIRDASELLARERDLRCQLEAEKAIRERLLGTITTEVLTQANVAKGWLALMRREHLDARARETVFSKIAAALEGQVSLLDELVGISPVATGHVNLDLRRVDVAAVARAVAADVGDHRARVIALNEAVVIADSEHLVRAMRSLIEASTREVDSVLLQVARSGGSVRVRFSSAVRLDDEALGVARRVAALYGGTLTVADRETVFELPVGTVR